MVRLNNSWDGILADEFQKPYYQQLRRTVAHEYNTTTCYPAPGDIFNALRLTPYENVRCVIIGQDPYHGPNQAHGLCFSVRKGTLPPPSLCNIFEELYCNTGVDNRELGHGELTKWAQSGVLLLNSVLTVRAGQPKSHANIGWEQFTTRVILELNKKDSPVVFLLWGADAQKKQSLLTNPKHLVLTAPHPSPLSAYRGFFGCGHFSKTNEFLTANGQTPIDWHI